MSIVKTNNLQLGQSNTATNNFTWYQPSVVDGTVRLGVGNAGATSLDALVINSSGAMTLQGTANGVAYLNGSKVLTTGSALTFDGTKFEINTAYVNANAGLNVTGSGSSSTGTSLEISYGAVANTARLFAYDRTGASRKDILLDGLNLLFNASGSEQMRLTSTGLGIGTSSPVSKLDVAETVTIKRITSGNTMDLNFYNGSGSGTAGNVARIRADGDNTSNDYGALSFWTGRIASAPISEKMRLDSSGNLGLGVTPSAWASGYSAMQIQRIGLFGSSSLDLNLTSNMYIDSVGYKYVANGYATNYTQYLGQHQWYTAPSGTAGDAISFTQAMTLSATGQLLVGVTSGSGIFQAFSGSTPNVANLIVGYGGSTNYYDANTQIFRNGNYAEAMRIDSSGNLLVGTTSFALSSSNSIMLSPSNGVQYIQHLNGTPSGTAYVNFAYNGSIIGQITQNGTTATAYNTSSDYRLKENIQPMQGALAVIQQLNPVTYTWKADGSDGQGFIAHELQAVVPDCVTGEKDAVDADGKPVYQGIDTSFLVATLTKAIQEQQEQINQLKAEVAALKGN